jgi:uncharacterized membrane protein
MDQSTTETNDAQGSSTTATPTTVPAPATESAAPVDDNNRMLFGILAYLGILVIIPYLMAKDDTFVRFHVKQGMVLCGIWIVLWVLGNMMFMLFALISIVNLGLLVLAIVGIVNVVQKKEAPLPLVGQLASKISL